MKNLRLRAVSRFGQGQTGLRFKSNTDWPQSLCFYVLFWMLNSRIQQFVGARLLFLRGDYIQGKPPGMKVKGVVCWEKQCRGKAWEGTLI